MADGVVLTGQLLNAVFAEDLYIISIDCMWTINGLTAGEGPIEVGFAHDDYTVSEVKEFLEASLVDPDNKISQEQSRRKVRRSGTFNGLSTNESLNDGKPIRTKMKFIIGDGHAINHWAKNRSGGALTSGAVVRMSGTIYGRWLR